jgi:DNA-binding LytR/AlgR family response regulator
MNTIIIEDNLLWQEKLESHILTQPSLKLLGAFGSVMAAYHLIHSESIDLIFVNLDIEGFKTLNFSKARNRNPFIVFSKANQTLPFNTENSIVVDIFTDSLNTQRFQKAIEKVRKWSKMDREEDSFFIRTKNGYVKLSYDEILYIKAMENFVQIITRKETFIKLVSMKKILEQLPTEQFLQVHRSFIVNKEAVISIEKDMILIENLEIPIGSSYKDTVLKNLVKQKLILR